MTVTAMMLVAIGACIPIFGGIIAVGIWQQRKDRR